MPNSDLTADEHPILMHGRSIRAILDDRKTQTRRPVKPQPARVWTCCDDHGDARLRQLPESGRFRYTSDTMEPWNQDRIRCPYGEPGHQLWVREAHYYDRHLDGPHAVILVTYDADGASRSCLIPADYDGSTRVDPQRKRPSIHMPRWACRLVLEVQEVRVERVQAISPEDAVAEGVPADGQLMDRFDRQAVITEFSGLWNDTWDHRQDEYGWEQDPWCWVIEFEVLDDG